jgi:hypothetical protein
MLRDVPVRPKPAAPAPGDQGDNVVTVVVTFAPFGANTQVAAELRRGVGRRATRQRIWSGYLPCTRGDLQGLAPRAVVALLCSQLRAVPDIADAPDDSKPVGSRVPLGTTGGQYTEPTLPGI